METHGKYSVAEAQKLINENVAPAKDSKSKWMEKYILYTMTSDLETHVNAENILDLFNTFHQILDHSPELAKELVTVLEGLTNQGKTIK